MSFGQRFQSTAVLACPRETKQGFFAGDLLNDTEHWADSGGAIVRSQFEMCQHFIPILKAKGTYVRKTGHRLARPARRGEKVLTIINGDVVAKSIVADDTSMVVRQESADHELYVLSAAKFSANYATLDGGMNDDPADEELKSRGYKYYARKGELLIYQITERDVEFSPSGLFEVSFSSIPQRLRVGDYLVTVVPDIDEVYVTRHASIYNDDGQLLLAGGALSQEEMCRRFLPILKQEGTLVKKGGRRLARPARRGEEVLTVINGEVMARHVVADSTSMVIRQESADHELYALEEDKFTRGYVLPGVEIDPLDYDLSEWRLRGFKSFERKGELMIYQVTDADMALVPGGKFHVAFSSIPQSLRVGDFLVTVPPECKEVYMSRHATIYNDDGRLFHTKGVLPQEEVQRIFLPRMKNHGLRMRRAGRRLARPARQGEEVLTIVDNEVVCKAVVLDTTSMVVQEESADREHYVLDGKTFAQCYELDGVDIEENSMHAQTLRARGFKYYRKKNAMVLIYRVTEEDLTFVPTGKFSVPFSSLPQPLRVGDYLVSRHPVDDTIYLSRNAEQIFFSNDNLEVHYLYASALDHPSLSLSAELEGLRTSGAVVRLTCATRVNLELLKRAWCRSSRQTVLHISCHTSIDEGTGHMDVILEDINGSGFKVSASKFLDLIIGGGPAPKVVVISSCHSEGIAAACIQRGVRWAIAVRKAETLLDRAAQEFAFSFYGELRAHRSVETAFAVALDCMRASREIKIHSEADKLLLLPAGDAKVDTVNWSDMHSSREILTLEPQIAMLVPFGAGDAGNIGPLVQPRFAWASQVMNIEPLRSSHQKFLIGLLEAFTRFRVIKLHGERGAGKTSLAGALATFAAYPGGRLFSGGVLLLRREADNGPVSQERMCERFLPILQASGTIVKKFGFRLARPAKLGEEVTTVVNGQVVSKVVVRDDTSMVIRQESSDHELYVLSKAKFADNYEVEGKEIEEEGLDYATLRDRGFKRYERKGHVIIYQVTEDDLKFVQGGRFVVPFSEIPQPLKVGDYLVTGYPESKEIYMSRNAEQIYSSHIFRSQDEVRRKFFPIISRRGIVMQRCGSWLARPAVFGETVLTIIDGEVVAKTSVADESSWVVHTDSGDGEWYVLSEGEFRSSYEQPGLPILEQGEKFDTWRQRGFLRYMRMGKVRVYKVTDEDMTFFPSGRFWPRRRACEVPRMLKVGDYLVMDYPDSNEIYSCPNAKLDKLFQLVPLEQIVRSQTEMVEKFIPLMKCRGTRMQRGGVRVARLAVRGEAIRTIVNGEVVAKFVVADDTSMIVRKETTDRELVALSADIFSKNYDLTSGAPVEGLGPGFDALRARGFMYYRRKGNVLVYEATSEDIKFVPGGFFQVPFSCIPQALRVGDYLVTNWPACDIVYVNRNAMQCYSIVADRTQGSRTEPCRLLPSMSNSRVSSCTSEKSSLVWRLRNSVKFVGADDGSMSDLFSTTKMAALQRSSPALLHDSAPLDATLHGAESSHSAIEGFPSKAGLLANCARQLAPGFEVTCTPSGLRQKENAARVVAELEELLVAAASCQASLAAKWYPHANSKRANSESSPKRLESEVEGAVKSWVENLPAGSRALIVLLDGARFLVYDSSRDLLRRLLKRYLNLSLLVTITDAPADGASIGCCQEEGLEVEAAALILAKPLATLDAKVEELPKLVAVPRLSNAEVADIFFLTMMRTQQGRPLGELLKGMGRKESVMQLTNNAAIIACQGLPRRARVLAEGVPLEHASLLDLSSVAEKLF